jgi:hypothetical protein
MHELKKTHRRQSAGTANEVMERKLISPTSLDIQAFISMASVRLEVQYMARRSSLGRPASRRPTPSRPSTTSRTRRRTTATTRSSAEIAHRGHLRAWTRAGACPARQRRARHTSPRGGGGEDFGLFEGNGTAAATAHPSARNRARPSQASPSRCMQWCRYHWDHLPM